MEISNESCLKAVFNFSETYNVTTPLTGNLETWWKNVIIQLERWEIQLYYIALKRAIGNGIVKGEISTMMINELEKSDLLIKNETQCIV
ncbi:hypothetical protein [Lysinibacillus sp. NPDC096212]|uniref:hypothetical protein n=1 Tax=Lysinibacillus sp. NPDC096212 TaxID=3364135 RepID=UPI00381B29BD